MWFRRIPSLALPRTFIKELHAGINSRKNYVMPDAALNAACERPPQPRHSRHENEVAYLRYWCAKASVKISEGIFRARAATA